MLSDGDWIRSIESTSGKASHLESFEAIENTTVLVITYADWQALQNKFPTLKDLTIQLLEKSIIRCNTRLHLLTIGCHTHRYETFLKEFSHLANRIPSGYVASFLNMRAETLSRVKRRLYEIDKLP